MKMWIGREGGAAWALAGLIFAFSTSASADSVKQRVLVESSQVISLRIAPDTVRCNDQGYSMPELKISVPQLDWVAQLNHRVPGEQLPCMSAGSCVSFGEVPPRTPEDVLRGGERNETVTIQVKLLEQAFLEPAFQRCTRWLVEQVDTVVAGIPFTHQKELSLGTLDITECERW